MIRERDLVSADRKMAIMWRINNIASPRGNMNFDIGHLNLKKYYLSSIVIKVYVSRIVKFTCYTLLTCHNSNNNNDDDDDFCSYLYVWKFLY